MNYPTDLMEVPGRSPNTILVHGKVMKCPIGDPLVKNMENM